MTSSAPRISPRLVGLVERLTRKGVPSAEIARLVGAEAEQLGLPRPSYEAVRRLAVAVRNTPVYPSMAEVALDVAFRARPPEAIVDQLAGTLPPKRS